MRRGWILIALAAAVAYLAVIPAALAKTFTPTRLGDPPANGCTRTDCSLREAITRANNHPGPDTVVLRGGKTYELSLPNSGGANEDLNASGDLDVLDALSLRSSNRKRATIDANGIDRVMQTDPAEPVDLSLRRITVRGGKTTDAGVERGGGIQSSGGGEIEVLRSKIVDNTATHFEGGGISAANGTLDVVHSVISRNHAPDDETGAGIDGANGAIGEVISISDSAITRNQASAGGGGIFSTNRLTVTRSLFARNNGGGGSGGAIAINNGTAKVVASTLSANRADGGGGAIDNSGTLRVVDSTLNGNFAGGALGGGAILTNHLARLTNDTISDNRAVGDGGGIRSFNTTNINAVTVARNESLTGDGGGIDAFSGPLSVRNSLVGLNLIGTGAGPDCHQEGPGVIVSGGHNLIGDTTDCTGVFGPQNDDIRNVNPRIAQLADNGGPTRTIALRATSPAIDHAGSDAPKLDQRGVKRDSKPDIGAFER